MTSKQQLEKSLEGYRSTFQQLFVIGNIDLNEEANIAEDDVGVLEEPQTANLKNRDCLSLGFDISP